MQGTGSRFTGPTGAFRSALLFVCVTLISGCSLLQKVGLLPEPTPAEIAVELAQQPYQLSLSLSASADTNPDTKGRPSPVQVRIFMVDQTSGIGDMPFEEVFEFSGQEMQPKPAATLTLRPGETRSLTLAANKSQDRLVIAAAFRDPYQSIWLSTASVSPQDQVSAKATINTSTITIESSP